MSKDRDTLFFQIVQFTEQAKDTMNALKALPVDADGMNGIDGRAVSIAITHLETAQLWVANARQ
jgi:hypothetical protein